MKGYSLVVILLVLCLVGCGGQQNSTPEPPSTAVQAPSPGITVEDVNTWLNYPPSPIVFQITGTEETLVLDYDTEKLAIDLENMTVQALKTGKHTVTATAGELTTTFTVNCTEIDRTDWDFYEKEYASGLKKQYSENKTQGTATAFIGDSFLHPGFFSSFQRLLGGKNAYCFGICGSTAEDWENYLLEDMIFSDIAPKNLVISLGTNDFYNDAKSQKRVAGDLQRLFLLLHEEMPDTQIYYFSIAHRTDFTYDKQIDKTNAQMERWCEGLPWVTFVDVAQEMTTDKLSDGIHPQEMCYETIYLQALENAGCVMCERQ